VAEPGRQAGPLMLTMNQQAPYPAALHDLVDRLTYKPNWKITLADVDRGQGSEGLTLCILIATPNSYKPDEIRSVMHYMIVPAAAYDDRSWQRWLLDQILLVETHEACEFFAVEGVKVFAPRHAPGNDPYTIVEYADDVDRRTSFRGDVKEQTS
jgi:hypothetical protein